MTCPLDEGKLTLPSISFDDPGKRCMKATHDGFGDSEPGPLYNFHYRQHTSYFGYRNNRYLTMNNLSNPAVRSIFERIVTSIERCTFDHVPRSKDFEVVITLRCISSTKPKFSYYIADHTTKTIRWAHQRQFNDNEELYDVGMRNVAEYWDHRSRFCVHSPCSQHDYVELNSLLDALPTRGPDSVLTAENIAEFKDRLAQRARIPPSTTGTYTVCDIHARVLKAQLREFYEPDLSLKSKLLKSLAGLASIQPQRFLHRKAHRQAGATISPPSSEGSNPSSSHPAIHRGSPIRGD